MQREAEWGEAALKNEVIRREFDFGRLPVDRDAGLQNEQVVEVSGVELAESEAHLLLSHRERRALRLRPEYVSVHQPHPLFWRLFIRRVTSGDDAWRPAPRRAH